MTWNGEPNKKEKYRTAMNKLVELYRFFDKHQIYLPAELCNSLEKLVKDVRELVINFGVHVELDDDNRDNPNYKEKWKAWTEGWTTIKNQVPLARRSLENEFRSLLGVAVVQAANTDATT